MQEFCSWLPSVQRCVSCVLGPRPLDLGVVVTWALPPPHLLAQACQHGPRDRESASASAGGGGLQGLRAAERVRTCERSSKHALASRLSLHPCKAAPPASRLLRPPWHLADQDLGRRRRRGAQPGRGAKRAWVPPGRSMDSARGARSQGGPAEIRRHCSAAGAKQACPVAGCADRECTQAAA